MDTLIDLETVFVELEDQFRPKLTENILSTFVLSTNSKTVKSQYPNLTLSRPTQAWADLPHVKASHPRGRGKFAPHVL